MLGELFITSVQRESEPLDACFCGGTHPFVLVGMVLGGAKAKVGWQAHVLSTNRLKFR